MMAMPMSAATKRSPLSDWAIGGARGEAVRLEGFAIADYSAAPRFGCKGPGAADWLAAAGLPVPAEPNTWVPLDDGGHVARLGLTEFLVETDASVVAALAARPRTAGVYPVLRQDLAVGLVGENLPELMAQTCNVNLAALDLMRRPVVLTSMAGVAVILAPGEEAGRPACRLWCDGTYGRYLWETVIGIAAELGAAPAHPTG